MKEKNKAAIAELGLLYNVIVWGSTFFIIKNTLLVISPLRLMEYRFLLAAFLTGVILIFQKKSPLKNWKEGLIMGLLLFFINAPQTLGMQFTTASNSAFITGLFIIFVPPFTYLLTRKKPSPKALIPIAVAVVGLWFLTGGIVGINLGDMMTLITAMVVGIQIVMVERLIKKGMDPFILNFHQLAWTAVLSLFFAAVTGNNISMPVDPTTIWTIVYLASFGSFLPLLIQFFAQKYISTIKVSLLFSLEPVFAALFAWTLGHELFIPERALGGLLIVAAIIMSELIEKRKSDIIKPSKA